MGPRDTTTPLQEVTRAGSKPPSERSVGEGETTEALRHTRDAHEKLVIATMRAQELDDAAAQAEALFNALPEIIARFDRELRNVYVNAAATALTGRPRSEFLGKTTSELGIPAEHLAECNGLLVDALESGKSAERLFALDLSGVERVFHVRTIPERDAAGSIASVVAVARDVTESEMYHRARADADRLRRLQVLTAALSGAPTPRDVAYVLAMHIREALRADGALVMLFDESGERLELAAAVGYPQSIVDRWSSLPVDLDAPLPDVTRTGEPLFFGTHRAVLERYPWLTEDRYEGDEAMAALPLTSNDRCFGAVAIVFRRPQQFAQEDREFIVSLTRQSVQAMDRARLLESERVARREAETANGLKDEFLATMSHELRTPLNAVMGWAMLLRTKTNDPVFSQRALEAIERNARIQATLVEDALDVSRIISGKLRLDVGRVDVGSVVSAAVDVVRAAADAKRIELHVALDDECTISGDAARLQQIVWNLVSNAVKFTPERGRVDVSLRCADDCVSIEVRDTGTGITPEFLPHVFERFRQFDGSTTRRHGGLGLGLAIVRHLVELHGGTVVAESQGAGKGATFRVTLPMTTLDGTPANDEERRPVSDLPPPMLTQDLAGVRLLVVDDNEDARAILCIALEACGAATFSADSAESALVQAASVHPDLLVCDIGMPGMDGYMLIRRLRALPEEAGGRIPAIAVTGFVRDEDVTHALAAGFQAHVGKPVDLPRFTRLVAKVLGRWASDGEEGFDAPEAAGE